MMNKNVRNVLSTAVITSVLAFSIGNGQAFAEESTNVQFEEQVKTDQSIEETNVTELEQVTEVEGTETEINSNDNSVVEIDEEVEDEEVSLIPSDFFYFAKKLMENVKLALTFSDDKEASLLAEFAEERIKEAEQLLIQGEYELAEEVLEKAIEHQEDALEKLEEDLEENQLEEDAETTDEIEDTTEKEEETNNQDKEENINDDSVDSVRAELEAKFSANIVALTAVLEKVENPKAKEAIQKNITKAQVKLEKKINKKLAKLAKENKEKEESETETEEAQTTESNQTNEVVSEVTTDVDQENLENDQEDVTKEQNANVSKTVKTTEVKTDYKAAEKAQKIIKKQEEKKAKIEQPKREKLTKTEENKQKENKVKGKSIQKQQEAKEKKDNKGNGKKE
ncbi:DUF5667 domain-containing protein [Metabacillus litoralis]|uniref:DUF5667 domain-containing protein n=1 Tax=Metabacillus litoralis TaxID=152268 RepID=UPI001CFD3674|nr:DUF5667 domain-containing protein [Metabacillus litoralis]